MAALEENAVPPIHTANQVRVELFGIPRARAGVAETHCQPGTLGSILQELAIQFPAFGKACLEQGKLRITYLANIGGDRFIIDLDSPVAAGQTLLILSADAGG